MTAKVCVPKSSWLVLRTALPRITAVSVAMAISTGVPRAARSPAAGRWSMTMPGLRPLPALSASLPGLKRAVRSAARASSRLLPTRSGTVVGWKYQARPPPMASTATAMADQRRSFFLPPEAMPSSILTNRLTSESQRLSLSSTACRRASSTRSSGRSLAAGIGAPCTSTGTTRMPRLSAVPVSRRMKSLGSESRGCPALSLPVSQLRPITATMTSVELSALSMASTKSSPASMPTTSMNTRSRPKCSASRSNNRPA